ncbi:MAG: HAD family phosphatase [Erysipelotrichaceae bacterium]|nr:HAD family phosphatase [Erysipelotrichaceae bacterium]
MIKAVLFDYNGTLFADDDINDMAWKATIEELSQGKIDADKFYGEFIGTRNYPFVEKMFEILGMEHDEEKIMYWAKRKETKYYHEICRKLGRDKLMPGAEELLDELKEKKIPFTMCTASLDVNVDFYFEQLHLDRWFDKKTVVYDDGIMTDKKDMYLEGAKRQGVDIKDCLIFDDSPASIRNAALAGCENIIVIKKPNNPDLPQIKQRIKDFTELDREVLKL